MEKEIILVVEDNTILREGLRDILLYEGFDVLTATHGLEALQQMDTVVPDLILSDISMPEMDGYELFRTVRSNPDWVTIPFLFLTARGEKQDILNGKTLGAEDYLVKPISKEELLTAIRSRLGRVRQIAVAQLHYAYESSLTVLANAIDVRDPYTRGHVDRVTAYAQELAILLGWQGRMLEQFRYGAILHDIGKIFIPESILLKPSELTKLEWEEVKKHPATGAGMIRDIPYLDQAVPIVRHHHERWDGQGYPDGLAKDQIPAGARIVAVADCFDAMTIDRPYRAGLNLDQACEEIVKCRNAQFDPTVVDAFQMAWEQTKLQPIWESWRLRLGWEETVPK
jgi:putative two-component system response regulator